MWIAQNLMGRSLAQLQALFLESRADARALEDLEEELRYRQSPQALALLLEVRRALADASVLHPAAP